MNSFKHAFQGRKAGKITISVRNIENEKLIIEISDNGVGMGAKEGLKFVIVNTFSNTRVV